LGATRAEHLVFSRPEAVIGTPQAMQALSRTARQSRNIISLRTNDVRRFAVPVLP